MAYKVKKLTKHEQKTHTPKQKVVSEEHLLEWAVFLYDRYIAHKERKEQNDNIRQKSR